MANSMNFIFGFILSPFVALFLLWLIRPFVRWVNLVLPENRFKRILFFYWK